MAYDTKARPMKMMAMIGPTKRIISTSYKGSDSAVGVGVWEGVVVDGVTPESCMRRCYICMLEHTSNLLGTDTCKQVLRI